MALVFNLTTLHKTMVILLNNSCSLLPISLDSGVYNEHSLIPTNSPPSPLGVARHHF